jgi:menaquinone-dependent protoporphyrinogen oxidase
MNDRPVLVAYGSKHGSTREIAERIAAVLRSRGLPVDVRTAETAGPPEGYRAIVLGSAVYMRRWRRPAARLLAQAQRSGAPLWLFSSGPIGDMPADPAKLVPKAVRAAAAREQVLFGGRVPLEPSNMIERAMRKNTPEANCDARDWDAIEGWAAEIADALTPAGASLRS